MKRAKSYGRSAEVRKSKIIQHQTSDFYPKRDQRKIKLSLYENDGIQLTVAARKKISVVISKALNNQQKK